MLLQLQLLGRPVITYHNAPVTQLNNRKAEAMLFYLALTPDSQRRHHLANLFWSDMPEDKALKNLRYTLWKLRQVLDDVPLEATRLTVSLTTTSSVWVDTILFQELMNSTGDRPDSEQIEKLEQAVSLYRGDFLAGFELSSASFFEEWVQKQRSALRNRYVDLLKRLAVYYTQSSHHEQALITTQKLIEADPWQETAHRRLMRLLALNGRRGAALEHYNALTHLLATDLGLEPEPDTVALGQQIRSGELVTNYASPADAADTESVETRLEDSSEYLWLLKQWESARQGIDPAAEGRCLLALGDFTKDEGCFGQALAHYEAALINFSQAAETRLAAACLINIAETYLMSDQFSAATACLEEASSYAQSGRHQDLISRIRIDLDRIQSTLES